MVPRRRVELLNPYGSGFPMGVEPQIHAEKWLVAQPLGQHGLPILLHRPKLRHLPQFCLPEPPQPARSSAQGASLGRPRV